MSRRRTIGVVAAGVIVLGACGGSSSSRSEVVAALTDVEMPGRYAELRAGADDVVNATAAWCTSGDAESLQIAVDAARASWVGLAPFWFGPVMDRRSTVIIDPEVRASDVVELLESDATLDAQGLRELYGADQRGLQAIETVVALAAEQPPTNRQCEYGSAVAALVADEADALAMAWTTAGPSMATDDAAANDALEGMVNESLFALAGFRLEDRPEVVRATLAGIRWALIGDEGGAAEGPTGISDLLSDDVVQQLTTELDAALALPDETAIMDLQRTITTNIVSALGLSVQFSDADGDG